jgi:phosphatidate cytidylyltransferase
VSNLALRFITGFIGVAIMMGCILWNEISFSLLFLGISMLSLNEFYNLTLKSGVKTQKVMGLIAGAFVYLTLSFFYSSAEKIIGFEFGLLFIPLTFLIFFIELYRKTENPFNNIAWTLTGIFYIPFSLALFTWISVHDFFGGYKPHIILGYFLILWTGDIAAYFVGINLGRRKLFERHSPKKTWEGSIGAAITSLLVAFFVSKYFTELPLFQWLGMAVIIIVAGTFGDLVESMFKRSISLKDSGGALPGHGGFLDRFDGVFLSAPFVFAFLKMVC